MTLVQIDIPARRRAAELISEYLAGRISGGDMEEAWPGSDRDKALEKIASEIFPEIGGGTLSEEFGEAGQEALRQILARCRAFLLSEYPYNWGLLRAPGCLTLMAGWAVLLLLLSMAIMAIDEQWFGVFLALIPVMLLTGLLTRFRRSWSRLESLNSGDLQYWPFEREEDVPASGAEGSQEHGGGLSK